MTIWVYFVQTLFFGLYLNTRMMKQLAAIRFNVVIGFFLFTLQMLTATVACAGDFSKPVVMVTQQSTPKEHDLHSPFGTSKDSAGGSKTGSKTFSGSGQRKLNEVDNKDYASLKPPPALRRPPPKLIPTH